MAAPVLVAGGDGVAPRGATTRQGLPAWGVISGPQLQAMRAEVETVRHIFACPHRELVARRANSVGGALRVLAAAAGRGVVSVPAAIDDGQ